MKYGIYLIFIFILFIIIIIIHIHIFQYMNKIIWNIITIEYIKVKSHCLDFSALQQV